MRSGWVVGVLLAGALAASPAQAQFTAEPGADRPPMGAAVAPGVQGAYYKRLRRSPWVALGWELLVPGAGNVYTRIYVNGLITVALTLVGSALWVHGAVADNDGTWWAGAGTFAAGRLYGVATATGGAMLYNRAVRRQLGLRAHGPPGWVLRF